MGFTKPVSLSSKRSRIRIGLFISPWTTAVRPDLTGPRAPVDMGGPERSSLRRVGDEEMQSLRN